MKHHALTSYDGVTDSHMPIDYDAHESEVVVHYTWYPSEAQTWNYPGCPAEIEITRIMLYDLDILPDCYDDVSLMEHFKHAAWCGYYDAHAATE